MTFESLPFFLYSSSWVFHLMFSLHFFPSLWILHYLCCHLRFFLLLSEYLLQQPLPLLWSLPLLNSNPGLTVQPISLNTFSTELFLVFSLFKLIPSYLLLTFSKISPECPIKVKTSYIRSCSKADEVNGKTPSASKGLVWFTQLSDTLFCTCA